MNIVFRFFRQRCFHLLYGMLLFGLHISFVFFDCCSPESVIEFMYNECVNDPSKDFGALPHDKRPNSVRIAKGACVHSACKSVFCRDFHYSCTSNYYQARKLNTLNAQYWWWWCRKAVGEQKTTWMGWAVIYLEQVSRLAINNNNKKRSHASVWSHTWGLPKNRTYWVDDILRLVELNEKWSPKWIRTCVCHFMSSQRIPHVLHAFSTRLSISMLSFSTVIYVTCIARAFVIVLSCCYNNVHFSHAQYVFFVLLFLPAACKTGNKRETKIRNCCFNVKKFANFFLRFG